MNVLFWGMLQQQSYLLTTILKIPSALNQLCTVTKESEGAGATGAEEHRSHGTCFGSLVLSIKFFLKESFAPHGGQSHAFNVLTLYH